MRINENNTKLLYYKEAMNQQRKAIVLDREGLEEVDEYKCLGILIIPNNEISTGTDQRITAEGNVMESLIASCKTRRYQSASKERL